MELLLLPLHRCTYRGAAGHTVIETNLQLHAYSSKAKKGVHMDFRGYKGNGKVFLFITYPHLCVYGGRGG